MLKMIINGHLKFTPFQPFHATFKEYSFAGYELASKCFARFSTILIISKKRKNTYEGVLLLIKLQALACNFTKSNTSPWVYFTFFKLYKWNQIAQSISMIVLNATLTHYPANIYFLSVNNKNRKRWKICSKLTIKKLQKDVIDFILVFLLITLNIFHIFF